MSRCGGTGTALRSKGWPPTKGDHMYIGGSIFLLALGAILAFAVQDRLEGVELTTVGYILMAAGALGIIVSLIINGQRGGGRRDDLPPPR